MKQLLTSLVAAYLCSTALSQPTNYYNRMNHVFGNINKTKVTTGYKRYTEHAYHWYKKEKSVSSLHQAR